MDEITKDELIDAMARRLGKEPSRAVETHKYGDPARHVKFERESMDKHFRIKEMLREWAHYYHDNGGRGYPGQSAFCTERVDDKNRSTETYYEVPQEIVELNAEIDKFALAFRRIIALEYLDRRPQKTKAAILGIPRQVFSQRLLWIHEQLSFTMWGE